MSSVLSLLPNGPELDKNNKFIVKEGNEVGLIICSAFVQLTEIHPIILRENILTQVRLEMSCHKMRYYYYKASTVM